VNHAGAWFIGGLATALLVSAAAIGCYAGTYPGPQPRPTVVGLLMLYTAAASLVGALLGFLFGVPRTTVPDTTATVSSVDSDHSKPNTNLEQISDWLTKILVGATLVQLGNVSGWAARLFRTLAEALDASPTAAHLIGALVVYSASAGFIFGWLTTRVWVAWLLDRMDARIPKRPGATARAERRLLAQLLEDLRTGQTAPGTGPSGR
jgi:hypothetical protein